MSKRKKNVEEFFSQYETNVNRSLAGEDLSAEAVRFFSNCLTESSPNGVTCESNTGEEFAGKVKQGMEFYRSIGTKSMTISSIDTTLLDDLHAMAKVYWRFTYEKEGNEGYIDFHNIYFLTNVTGELKVFCFIAGDAAKAFREAGLIHEEVKAE